MRYRQRGMVLVLTLLVLAAMLFSFVALMQSVGTATTVSGNLAFKDTSMKEAHVGLYQAIKSLMPCGTSPCGHYADNAYISYVQMTESALLDNNTWTNSPYVHTLASTVWGTGYKVKYIVDRLSDNSLQNNVKDSATVQAHSFSYIVKDQVGSRDDPAEGVAIEMPTVFYRITVRIEGPNNTLYMAQATVTVTGA